jgi:hypothetical protein
VTGLFDCGIVALHYCLLNLNKRSRGW